MQCANNSKLARALHIRWDRFMAVNCIHIVAIIYITQKIKSQQEVLTFSVRMVICDYWLT